jgi:hypothetical protein
MGTAGASRIKRHLLARKPDNKGRSLGDKLGELLGGGNGNSASSGASTDAVGTKTPKGTVENGVAAAAGSGSKTGLPTVDADGVISMTMHQVWNLQSQLPSQSLQNKPLTLLLQVNQDGAGPMIAAIDPTSGGTDESAFQPAQMIADVPGAIAGLSTTTTTDFPIKVQMPVGMTCSGTIAGQTGVCVVRVKNSALAGPFGGSAVFTQDTGAAGNATAS